ncbi:hypothetical protein GOV04_02360 [Candidatus Woesearchaeota archaeon]|nr:hypothetical protein [Candidatus Woesearchaeota archaeon]
MNKKAQQETLRNLLLLIIVLALLSVFLYTTLLKADNIVDEELCLSSAVMQHAQKTVSGNLANPFSDINCPAKLYELENKDLDLATAEKLMSQLNKRGIDFDNTTPEEFALNNFLAQRMESCWRGLGSGKLDLFDSNMIDRNRACVLCSVVEFDELNIDKNTTIDLGYWLKNVEYKSTGISYFEHLLDPDIKERPTVYAMTSNMQYFYNIEKPVAVVFARYNGGKLSNLQGTVGTAGGAVGGAIVGATICSVVPVGGTIVCGVGGGLLGALAGSGAPAISNLLSGGLADVDEVLVIPYTVENLQLICQEVVNGFKTQEEKP